MWTPLRKEISQVSVQLDIPQERFKPVSLHDWQSIQNNIIWQFCYPNMQGWIWERLKGDTYAIRFHYNYPFDQLLNLVDHTEKVWLLLNDSFRAKQVLVLRRLYQRHCFCVG